MRPDGSDLRRLTTAPPARTPIRPGRRTAARSRSRAPGSGPPRLFVMQADGSGQREISPLGDQADSGGGTGVFMDANPAWSPDGALDRVRDHPAGNAPDLGDAARRGRPPGPHGVREQRRPIVGLTSAPGAGRRARARPPHEPRAAGARDHGRAAASSSSRAGQLAVADRVVVRRAASQCSWPHAASISRPRVSRTVTATPAAQDVGERPDPPRRSSAGRPSAGSGSSGSGSRGRACAGARGPSSRAWSSPSLTPSIIVHSIDGRRPVRSRQSSTARSSSASGHSRLTGTSSLAEVVVGRVEADREADLRVVLGRAAGSGNDADGRHRDVPAPRGRDRGGRAAGPPRRASGGSSPWVRPCP